MKKKISCIIANTVFSSARWHHSLQLWRLKAVKEPIISHQNRKVLLSLQSGESKNGSRAEMSGVKETSKQ